MPDSFADRPPVVESPSLQAANRPVYLHQSDRQILPEKSLLELKQNAAVRVGEREAFDLASGAPVAGQ